MKQIKAKGPLNEENLACVIAEMEDRDALLLKLGKYVVETDDSIKDWLYEGIDSGHFTEEEYNAICEGIE